MAPDERLSAVATFVEAFLEAEADLARAALGEPDDDTYLRLEAQVRAMLAPGRSTLAPQETRWAVPGGTTAHATIDVSDSVRAAPLYAVARVETEQPTWVAYTGSRRDATGTGLADALRVEVGDGALVVTGRAGRNPFTAVMDWEAGGGDPVPFDAPVVEYTTLRTPTDPEHAAWLSARLSP
jgi:hypothetical protein